MKVRKKVQFHHQQLATSELQAEDAMGSDHGRKTTSCDDGDAPPAAEAVTFSVALIAAMLFLAEVICYADRVAISLAIVVMQEELHYSDSVDGMILSAFFWGYAITQIPGGYLAGRHGGRPVLAAAVLVWSLSTLLTPLAASAGGLQTLLAVRFVMGLGEGMSLPSIHQLSAETAPASCESRFITFVSSGMFMGGYKQNDL